MRRDWSAARAKVDGESVCRIQVGCAGPLDAAHIISRSRFPGPACMEDANIVPLCRRHHEAFDGGRLDLLPYLTYGEQAMAASLVGLAAAWVRLTGGKPLPATSQTAGSNPPTPSRPTF